MNTWTCNAHAKVVSLPPVALSARCLNKQQISVSGEHLSSRENCLTQSQWVLACAPNADKFPIHLVCPPAGPHLSFTSYFRAVPLTFSSFQTVFNPGLSVQLGPPQSCLIRSLLRVRWLVYLRPAESLFRPPLNDLGKLTCSASQDCNNPMMSGRRELKR